MLVRWARVCLFLWSSDFAGRYIFGGSGNGHLSNSGGGDHKGMYNGYILGMPRRIIDDMDEREIEKRGLSSLS
jgi:hypothetical protein